jgi:cell division protein FtsN
MAISFLKRRPGVFDLAIAGFAGAAFTFAAFYLPEWRLTQLSLATGLADIFPPARPPLGFTARALFAIVIGLIACGGSLLLLRLAERRPVPKHDVTEADAPPAPIRLRRADAHPDAPARRPLAARDLGEPAEPVALLAPPSPEPEAAREEELMLAPDAEIPAFLVEQEPEQETETVEAEAVEAEPETPLVWPQPAAEPAPEPELAEALAPEPVAETPATEAVAEAPAPVAEAEDDPSISKLMQRLEFGLAKRERAAPLDPSAIARPADDAVGHRLRSAIGDLQKLASRG